MDIAEGRLNTGTPTGTGRTQISSEKLFFVSLVVYLVSYVFMAAEGNSWLRFQSANAVWYISFAASIFFFARSSYPKRMISLGPLRSSLIMFGIALLLQAAFLLRDPSLSQDIMWLQMRGENLVDGKFPYQDFAVNKPPLYIWMVGLISVIFGPGEAPFRIIFVIANSLIPVAMLAIYRHSKLLYETKGREEGHTVNSIPSIGWGIGSLAYALWPVGILEVGLAGHFDPVVVIAVLISYLFLIRGKPFISGLFLGTGFSLKLFPLLLLPIFLLSFKKWKDRISILAGFSVVFVVSSLPILFKDPVLLMDYFRYQAMGWYSGLSVRFLLELMLDLTGIPTSFAAILLNLALIGGGVYIYYRGLKGRIRRIDLTLTVVLTALLTVLMIIYNLAIIDAGSDSLIDWAFGIFSLGRSVFFIGLAVYLFTGFDSEGIEPESGDPENISNGHIPMDLIPVLSTMVLFLLLLCSAQFHPWYLLWIFPFAMASNPKISWIVIFIFGFLQTSAYPPWEIGGF